MEVLPTVIFIPVDEKEARSYLSILIQSEPELSVIVSRYYPANSTAITKLQHLVKIRACEEMSAAENDAFEEEIARYELDIQKAE